MDVWAGSATLAVAAGACSTRGLVSRAAAGGAWTGAAGLGCGGAVRAAVSCRSASNASRAAGGSSSCWLANVICQSSGPFRLPLRVSRFTILIVSPSPAPVLWIMSCWPGSTHMIDRKSTRLNSSHLGISYAVFCLKKKKTTYPYFFCTLLYGLPDPIHRAFVMIGTPTFFFFFNDPATTEISPLSLHDALPI